VSNTRRSINPDERAQVDTPDPPALDYLDQPPLDRYCDVVLTGGVTDGVIYPWAVVELARKYRFKNIGGTSVGAMAATLTAAAEYSRRRGSLTGFNEVLLKLPRKLGENVNGMTRLYSLFQPARSTRRLFALFVGLFETKPGAGANGAFRRFLLSRPALNKDGPIGTLENACKPCAFASSIFGFLLGPGRFVRVVLCAYRVAALIGVLVAFLFGIAEWWFWHSGSPHHLLAQDLLTSLPWAIVLAIACIGLAIVLDLIGGFLENNFGLCKGFHNETAPPEQQSLVEWLHQGVQAAAGRPLDRPLTFRDLWEAPGGPVGRSQPPRRQKRKSRSIDLRMVTTNLTHQRPYALPPEDETSRLFFRRKDLESYFPQAILDHLVAHAQPYASKVDRVDPDPVNVPADLLELPAGDLPIVVAARLSLSFPLLFSAVPLWAIDYEAGKFKDRRLRRCWFSDGGICSNFPIHLFDASLPRWPTFGIALVPRSLFWPKEAVYLPEYYNQGRGDRWDRFGDEILPVTGKRVPPGSRLLGFLASIIWSAKNWKDKTSMRMPGVRDRVVRVNLKPGEGGLNLKLTRSQILRLAADYGTPAGKELVFKFVCLTTDGRLSQFWDEHRWVRFNCLLVALRERIEGISAAAELAAYSTPLSAQIANATRVPPLSEKNKSDEKLLTQAQADDLQSLLAALKDLESKFAQAELPQPYTPLPTPSMRIRPPL